MTSRKSMICLFAAFFVIFMGFSRPASAGKGTSCYKPYLNTFKKCHRDYQLSLIDAKETVEKISKESEMGYEKWKEKELKKNKKDKEKAPKNQKSSFNWHKHWIKSMTQDKLEKSLEKESMRAIRATDNAEKTFKKCAKDASSTLVNCYRDKYSKKEFKCSKEEFKKEMKKFDKWTLGVMKANEECNDKCAGEFNKVKDEFLKNRPDETDMLYQKYEECHDDCEKRFTLKKILKKDRKSYIVKCIGGK